MQELFSWRCPSTGRQKHCQQSIKHSSSEETGMDRTSGNTAVLASAEGRTWNQDQWMIHNGNCPLVDKKTKKQVPNWNIHWIISTTSDSFFSIVDPAFPPSPVYSFHPVNRVIILSISFKAVLYPCILWAVPFVAMAYTPCFCIWQCNMHFHRLQI